MNHVGEIITFQVGSYANYAGAHFFNLQDPQRHPENEYEFNSKVFWKERRGPQRERSWTPRTLMFDLKDNWSDGFIRKSNNHTDTLFGLSTSKMTQDLDKVQQSVQWEGNIQRIIAPSNDSPELDSAKNLNQTTQTDFKNWGDFTGWKLHRTEKYGFSIPNFMYNAESDKLVGYGQGLYVYRKLEEDVIDGIRLYAEDCDYLEGFHMLVDEYDGFTGIAAGILEHLGDEYDKKACLGLGLNHPISEETPLSLKDYKIRISNTVQLWSSFNRHARVFTSLGVCEDIFALNPVAKSIPNLIQDCSRPYISSAFLAAALDSITAPYRLASPSFPLHEMTSLLNAFGHKMTVVGSSVPLQLNQRSLFKHLDSQGLSSLVSLTPNVSLDLGRSLGNLFVIRGIRPESVISKSESREYKHANIGTPPACLELYCQESYSKSVHVIKDIKPPFKSVFPFPALYDSSYLDEQSTGKGFDESKEYWLLPTLASAHNSPVVEEILETIVSTTGGGIGGSSMKMKSFFAPSSESCNSAGLEFEDYAENVNDLNALKETYSKE